MGGTEILEEMKFECAYAQLYRTFEQATLLGTPTLSLDSFRYEPQVGSEDASSKYTDVDMQLMDHGHTFWTNNEFEFEVRYTFEGIITRNGEKRNN